MRRVIVLFGAVLALASGGSAAASPLRPAAPPPLPGAWILVDADTGAVLDSGNARTPLRPASVTKVITALAAIQALPADASIPVSARAEAAPANKINMKAGQTWAFPDVLNSLMLASANDAAVALAERVSGSLDGFAGHLAGLATRLGMQDGPVLRDPAGLDDEFSVQGGNLISARDIAIATRAALAAPLFRDTVMRRDYRFHGGDGIAHRVVNHNRLLKAYPGAIGVKTGYTRRAGHSLVGAATRHGRTMLAVVLKAPDSYGSVSALLDKGFATPLAAEAGLDRLPPVPRPASAAVPRAKGKDGAKGTGGAKVAKVTKELKDAKGPQVAAELARATAAPAPPGDPPVAAARPSLPTLPRLGAPLGVVALGLVPAAAIGAIARPRSRRRAPAAGSRSHRLARQERPEPRGRPERHRPQQSEGHQPTGRPQPVRPVVTRAAPERPRPVVRLKSSTAARLGRGGHPGPTPRPSPLPRRMAPSESERASMLVDYR